MQTASIQIGELAKRTTLSIDAIRFYEKRQRWPVRLDFGTNRNALFLEAEQSRVLAFRYRFGGKTRTVLIQEELLASGTSGH